VEEANLSVNIATLRKALGEIAGEHQYIQAISKRGYRFVANVVEVESESRTVAMREPRPALIANKEGTTDLHQGLNSLAVLPFDNETADPNAEYLSDGLTESIINNISQLQNLRVVARNDDELALVRHTLDPKRRVIIKRNPSDLSLIHVYDEKHNRYLGAGRGSKLHQRTHALSTYSH